MNFGQNLYNWFLSNAQSLVLLAIVVIGHMHSARETMGKDDQKSLEKLVRVFFEGFY